MVKNTTMGRFLAYFDLLGYSNFIKKNSGDPAALHQRIRNFARNNEQALALDLPLRQSRVHSGTLIPDISQSRLQCLIFSDTVLFFTNDNPAIADFDEIIKVAYRYNWFNIRYDFPSRGCIVYGDLFFDAFDQENQRGGQYRTNDIYGIALVNAHEKAEAASWAGCVLDTSAIEYAQQLGNIQPILDEHTKMYDVPYKDKNDPEVEVLRNERTLTLLKGGVVVTKYHEDGIKSAFTKERKGEIKDDPQTKSEKRIKQIFDNTIRYFRTHQKSPFYYKTVRSQNETVFGKFEEGNVLTTVVRQKDEQQTIYTANRSQLVLDEGTDISFVAEPEITAAEFEEVFNNVT